jgi:putative Mn2+ efflux pump MntP
MSKSSWIARLSEQDGEGELVIQHDMKMLVKVVAVAFAVGLDVLAVSIGVGVAQLALDSRVRLGMAFAGAEIAMQVVGYELGTGAGKLLGAIATYTGIALLASIGGLMVWNSSKADSESEFDATRGAGLLMTSLSISLDSLGVGVALPAAGIPLLPLLFTVSITTTVFTFIGLAFGARLGQRYELGAARAAGTILMLLAGLFLFEQLPR